MSYPVKNILSECQTGFTVGRKFRITLCVLIYLVSPIDLIPEPLLPFGVMDDLFALFLMLRVLVSPTLPKTTPTHALTKSPSSSKGRVTR